jgi:hypothetical protein
VVTSDVYLIIDRYVPTNRKEGLRENRGLGASRVYRLNVNTKKVALTVSQNKSALTDPVCKGLIKPKMISKCITLSVLEVVLFLLSYVKRWKYS